MDEQRALLDQLMGVNRNLDRAKEEIKDYRDKRVCKFFLLGVCPHGRCKQPFLILCFLHILIIRRCFQNFFLFASNCYCRHVCQYKNGRWSLFFDPFRRNETKI